MGIYGCIYDIYICNIGDGGYHVKLVKVSQFAKTEIVAKQ